MVKPILISALVAVVILTECVLAYMLIPSAADVEARLDAHETPAAAGHQEPKKDDGHGAKDDGHGKEDAHGKADDHGKKDAHGAKPAKAASGHGGGHGAKPAAKPAAGGHGGGHGAAASTAKVPAGSGTGGEVEVELGKFNLMVHEPASNVTLRVNFHLVATVEDGDSEEVSHLLEKNQHRLRRSNHLRNSQCPNERPDRSRFGLD